MRGQGYDGASNMRGEWNGLQALFMKDCPYAYYVHCFAHRLQLALRHDELQAAQLEEIAHLLEIDEIVTGKGINQIGTLKRAGDTRWGSHFSSICSLINMYEDIVNAMCLVGTTKYLIQVLREDGWDALFTEVKNFCEKHDIEIPDLNDVHSTTKFGRSRLQQGQ
ncbi:uncharacterized protein, partial [Cicer arietinum]